MKILYRYIIREHIAPFFFALAVITFVLILDFILEVVNLVIGKGINVFIILQIFVLNLAWILALSVPMAVLVSTLMAFGRLSEDNEITALKASGVSTYKIIFPPLSFSILIALFLIWFNNNVLPDANHNARILMSSIHQKRPTLNLRENVFLDDIPGYQLLVKKVDPHSSKVKGVTIYDQKDRLYPRTIIAEQGEIEFTPDGNTLILKLFNGEMHEVDEADPNHYRRVSFDRQTIYIPDVGSQLVKASSEYRTDREMSAKMMREEVKKIEKNILLSQKNISQLVGGTLSRILSNRPSGTSRSSANEKSIISDLTQKNKAILYKIRTHKENIKEQKRQRNSYLVEIHKKYSIPFACLVFILMGAPLGIMAKKGGIAVGAGLSVGFFILYWAFLIGGEELADRSYIPAFWAMWSANIFIGIAGIYILIRTAKEATFFSWKWTEKLIPKRLR
jgi:lipopolysaccharide export system permease protein